MTAFIVLGGCGLFGVLIIAINVWDERTREGRAYPPERHSWRMAMTDAYVAHQWDAIVKAETNSQGESHQ